MAIINIVWEETCGNIKYCIGRAILQYSILYWEVYVKILRYCLGRNIWQHEILYSESYVAIINIVYVALCGNIKYCVGRAL